LSSEEVKIKRSKSRKRNFLAKELRDTGEHKGAYAIKIIDPRKQEYKRIKKVNIDYDDETYD